ncbi:MAG: type IV pilus modification protein PilV, partial [Xanthomonadaceae bacterium]|nr:type IV pilus modification protein PilV [Xanthomonadaceae bacterium]
QPTRADGDDQWRGDFQKQRWRRSLPMSIAIPQRRQLRQRIGAAPVRGMSMIEVLVSVMVLGIGLLGIAAMQSIALRGGQGSLETSQAVMASNSIIEAMRANRANAAAYVYDGTTSCTSTPAAGTTLASNDLNFWVTSLKNTIGSATTTCGKIVSLGGNNYRVTVQWDDTRAGNSTDDKRQIVTDASI